MYIETTVANLEALNLRQPEDVEQPQRNNSKRLENREQRRVDPVEILRSQESIGAQRCETPRPSGSFYGRSKPSRPVIRKELERR